MSITKNNDEETKQRLLEESRIIRQKRCNAIEVKKREDRFKYIFYIIIFSIPLIIWYLYWLVATFETITLTTGYLWLFILIILITFGFEVYFNITNTDCAKDISEA